MKYARISTPLPTWSDVGEDNEEGEVLVNVRVVDTLDLPELCLSAFAEPIDLLDFDLSLSLTLHPTKFPLHTFHLNLLTFLISNSQSLVHTQEWFKELRRVFRNKRALARDTLQRQLPPQRRANGMLPRRRLQQ